MGACALLGSLMVPEMMKRGYSKYLSIGPIMGVGGLAVIIPPSALTVLLATLGHTDVGDLLIAGVIPGLRARADVRRADLGLDACSTRRPRRRTPPPQVAAAGEAAAVLRRRDPDGGDHRVLGADHARRLVHADRGRGARRGVGDRARRLLRRDDLEGVRQVARRRAARDRDGVPDHLRLGHLRPGARLHRRLERADELGARLRGHAARHAAAS